MHQKPTGHKLFKSIVSEQGGIYLATDCVQKTHCPRYHYYYLGRIMTLKDGILDGNGFRPLVVQFTGTPRYHLVGSIGTVAFIQVARLAKLHHHEKDKHHFFSVRRRLTFHAFGTGEDLLAISMFPKQLKVFHR